MYEFLKILQFATASTDLGKRVAFATIYKVEGSSYRKKWTQMAIAEDLSYEGHLSGGCVEKEILRHAESVFRNKKNISFEYDGSLRLGCEGVINIQIEQVNQRQLQLLSQVVMDAHQSRSEFYQGMIHNKSGVDTFYQFGQQRQIIFLDQPISGERETRTIYPQNQLVVIGNEFDSAILCDQAQRTGYKVTQIVGAHYPMHKIAASKWTQAVVNPEDIPANIIFDRHTAVVLMTHAYHRDLNYISYLLKYPLAYLGTLGPKKRKHKIINYLLDQSEDWSDEMLATIENIKGPIGIDIPSKTPEEISISILAELITAFSLQMK